MAALGRRYRVASYSGVAGCVGFAALDVALIVGVLVVAGVLSWVTAVAMACSIGPDRAVRPGAVAARHGQVADRPGL